MPDSPFANSVKFLRAVNLLASPQGTTVKGIMENLDISRRSVFRLLASLDELGFPLTDEQSKAKNEKTYRLAESYVLKLPNMSIPNPNFSNEEARLLLSVLDDCIRTRRTENITLLKSTRQKIMSMVPKGKGRHK